MTTRTLALSPESLNFLQKLKQLDLGAIAYKLMHPEQGKGWTKKQATRALLRYMMFLFLLHLYPNQNIIPTVEIDQVWHHHILSDVDKYIQDCEMLFGRLLNHASYPQSEDDINTWQASFSQTQELFQQHFDLQLLTEGKQSKPARCQPPINDKKQHSVALEIPDILDYFTLS